MAVIDASNATVGIVDAATVVQVHAAVIAILFGLVGAYALSLVARSDEHTRRVIDTARRANEIIVMAWFPADHRTEYEIDRADAQLARLRELLEGDLTGKGPAVVATISAIVASYPFRPLNLITEGDTTTFQPNELDFGGVEAVKSWCEDAWRIAGGLELLVRANELKIRETLRTTKWEAAGIPATEFMSAFVTHTMQVARELNSKANEASAELGHYQAFVRGSRDRSAIVLGFLLLVIAFTAGVVIPLTTPLVSTWTFVGIPFLCYAFLLGVVVASFQAKLPQAKSDFRLFKRSKG